MDVIRVTGARENNLANLCVDIPKRQLTVFTGVSGSGKSSLVFSTIAAESTRLLNETYPAYVQGFMANQERPDVDSLEGLTAAVAVDQERLGANPRSTLGTATDVDPQLRLLFSRIGHPHIGGPQSFSFNVPSVSGSGVVTTTKKGQKVREHKTFQALGGMCAQCEGTGRVSDIDVETVVDFSASLDGGALDGIPGFKSGQWALKSYSESGFFDPGKAIADYTEAELHDLLYKEPTKIKFNGYNTTYEGLIPRIQKTMLSKSPEAMQPSVKEFADRAVVFRSCPECEGTRLASHARNVKIEGVSIADVAAMEITQAAQWIRTIKEPAVEPLVSSLREMFDSFVEIGLGYLSLNRPASSLSGGEAQRAKMVRHLGSSLTDITYVFDEPTVGLHPHDVTRMNKLLMRLRDKGNTVLVVEHAPEVIRMADHVIDLGPQAGSEGGKICFEGTPEELKVSGTLTGKHLADRPVFKEKIREASGAVSIRCATVNNLKNVDVDIPLGILVAVTGVAGSGKSSLLRGSMPEAVHATVFDQTPIRGSRRSNPATYTGMAEPIRKSFAKANGVKPALFSANSEGACPACNGAGRIFTDLAMMATVSSTCEVCEGKRFNDEILQYSLGGLTIVDVLELTAASAMEFFSGKEHKIPLAARIAKNMTDAGLGYVKIGQPLHSLSGGERQRLKLAMTLGESSEDSSGLLILDEPSAGLHMADVEALLTLLDRLVDAGKSVIVIEHDMAVVAHADWVIDLGPGAGSEGGTVVFEGKPYDLAASSTLTGVHLREATSGL